MSTDPIDFAALFELAPNPYMLLDRELRFVAVNQAYLDITASQREALIGRGVFDMFPDDATVSSAPAQRLRESFLKVLATGQRDVLPVIPYRVPTRTADGIVEKERIWSATHTPILDRRGQVGFILQHTVDITELHQLRQQQAAHPDQALGSAADVLRRAEAIQATNALLDAERQRFRLMFDQAPVFFCYLSEPEHRFELTNPAYAQLIARNDVIGRTVAEAIPEAVAQGFLGLLDGVRDSGKPFIGRGVKLALRQPSGEMSDRYLDFIYQPITQPNGQVSGIFVVGSDVTEQHLAATESARLATVVEQSVDFIGIADLDGNLLYINEAGYELLALDPTRQSTLKAIDLFLPEDHAFIASAITPALQSEGRWRGEFRFRNLATGEAIPVDYHVFAIRDPRTGEVSAIASVTRDLRDSQALQQELSSLAAQEARARESTAVARQAYQFLADAIPIQVWTANPAGGLTYVNTRVTEYFARTAADMMNTGWQGVVHSEDLPAILPRWMHSLATGEAYDVEFRLRRAADESYRWHVARALPMRDATGAITTWYGTNTDIDDSKRAARERDDLIAALQRSNRELDRFAYVASHDLKTPLRGIGSLARWVEEDLGAGASEEVRKHLGLMRSRVARMGALIDGVLTYSRATKSNEPRQDVDVRDLLDVVVDMLAPGPHEHFVVPATMPRLHTSYTALQQVFLNLMSNALKHAHSEDVQVRIGVTETETEWIFSVGDNGPGIAPQHHDRIWRLFQTLESPHLAERNTGVGLSVVKRNVETRGGRTWIESIEGQGATFFFSWPKHEAEGEPANGA